MSSPTVSTATRGKSGGQCSNCGAHLAADQRYCVECGRRTNEARPTLMREEGFTATAASAAPATTVVATRSTNGPQTLIIGIGVLLLAVGVGVLIGHNNNGGGGSNTNASAPIVYSAAPAAAAATTPGAAVVASTPDASTGAASTADTKAAKKAAKAAAKAAAAAPASGGAVTPKAGKKVKLGDTGSGPGYDKKSGKFTGNFFGG